MSLYTVELAPVAQNQADTIDIWWRTHRLAASNLFDDEMAAAIGRLSTTPPLGAPYREFKGRAVHRLLLARTSYHVYFHVQEEQRRVRVLAVWHASRGREPRL